MTLSRKATKHEKQNLLARLRIIAEPLDLDVVDNGDHIKLTTAHRPKRMSLWWIETLKNIYFQDHCVVDGEKIKIRPETGVELSVNRRDGTLKIKGKLHWHWLVENLEDLLHRAEEDVSLAEDFNRALEQQLGFEDGVDPLPWLKDLPRAGAIKDGPRFIYPLWKALLHKWLSLGAAVTIASPNIDARRLADIYLLLIRNKDRHGTVQLYTHTKPQRLKEVVDDAKNILSKIKDEEMKKRSLLNKNDIEWAVNKVPSSLHSFHCNLIAAAITEDKNEILVTSARFTRTHFDLNACDTVSHAKMTDKGLRDFYLIPLGIKTRASSEASLLTKPDGDNESTKNFSRSNTLPRNYNSMSRSLESLDRRSESVSRSDKSITRPGSDGTRASECAA